MKPTNNPSLSPGQQTRPSEALAVKIVNAFLANFSTTQKDMGDWIEQYAASENARLIAERDGLVRRVEGLEKALRGLLRACEKQNTFNIEAGVPAAMQAGYTALKK